MTVIVTRMVDQGACEKLMAQGVSEFEAKIYAARGIGDQKALDTGLSSLLPYHSLKNIDVAASALREAIHTQEKILIVADYDADGATACAVAVKGLRLLGAKVDFLIPNRFEDGYGLTPEIVEQATQYAPDWILTVDNGISSVAGVACARALGIKVLITDHHLPGESLPDAIIVNPNQVDCAFPSKNLAGVGVIFYVLLALRALMRAKGDFATGSEPNLATLLDLVALGTVADVVKLDSNNRILVAQGLKRMRSGQACSGMMALFTVSGRDITRAAAFDLGFTLGPRINAAGRMLDMSLGVACLIAENGAEALRLAQQLDELNRERRHVEADIQVEAQAILERVNVKAQCSVSLYDSAWHEGVIGIVASRIKEQYHRPCFVFAKSKAGFIKGSGRSIQGLHLRDALDLLDKEAPGLLLRFGGHAMAAGVSILEEDFQQFSTHFEALCARLLDEAALQKSIYVDGIPPKEAYQLDVVEKLDNQIWGQGFHPPLFVDEFEVISQRIVGEKHLKLQLKSQYGHLVEAMHFQSTDLLPSIFSGVFRLNVNTFREQQMVQLVFQHIQLKSESST